MPDVMERAVEEITDAGHLPYFSHHVLFRHELTSSLQELHNLITKEKQALRKEELFLHLLEELICRYSDVMLNDLSELTGWSKYHLLRSFTKQKGITPNSYLETIRINQAKKLLEQGVRPIDAAIQTRFSDQSHMTKFFKRQVGLTPKQYMKIFEREFQNDHSTRNCRPYSGDCDYFDLGHDLCFDKSSAGGLYSDGNIILSVLLL
jgi:AraC-like DNA-binding protein